jgi:hypothetical protein
MDRRESSAKFGIGIASGGACVLLLNSAGVGAWWAAVCGALAFCAGWLLTSGFILACGPKRGTESKDIG